MNTIVLSAINHSDIGVMFTNLANYGAPPCRCHRCHRCNRCHSHWVSYFYAISMVFQQGPGTPDKNELQKTREVRPPEIGKGADSSKSISQICIYLIIRDI